MAQGFSVLIECRHRIEILKNSNWILSSSPTCVRTLKNEINFKLDLNVGSKINSNWNAGFRDSKKIFFDFKKKMFLTWKINVTLRKQIIKLINVYVGGVHDLAGVLLDLANGAGGALLELGFAGKLACLFLQKNWKLINTHWRNFKDLDDSMLLCKIKQRLIN